MTQSSSAPMPLRDPAHLRDPALDRAPATERDAYVTRALREQLDFALAGGVEFWRQQVDVIGFDPARIESLADFARLPILSKSRYRALPAWELVPRFSRERLTRCFATSGTTGRPTTVFWTDSDWRALVQTVTRHVEPQRPRECALRALNGYHQGHTAGPTYDAVIRMLGGFSLPRHYAIDDERATLSQIEEFRCDVLILPQRSGPKKSAKSVEDLLVYAPTFFRDRAIRWWLGSSSTFTPEVRRRALDQGVQSVTNLYGSSEFGILGVSCPLEPGQFHLTTGHVYVEVVDVRGDPVVSGKRGRLIVSHLRASHADGGLGPHEGSQILRLANGDEALYWDDACPCGQTAPRIENLTRSE